MYTTPFNFHVVFSRRAVSPRKGEPRSHAALATSCPHIALSFTPDFRRRSTDRLAFPLGDGEYLLQQCHQAHIMDSCCCKLDHLRSCWRLGVLCDNSAFLTSVLYDIQFDFATLARLIVMNRSLEGLSY